MSSSAVRQLCAVVFLTLLGLALVHAGPITTAAADAGEQRHPPTLLWKKYPLKERPTARDVVTIDRALRILDTRTTQGGRRGPAAARSPAIILWLGLAVLLLGIASLPDVAFPDPRVAAFVTRWRTEVVVVGGAVLLCVLVALVLG